ncbi:hypothetical protein Pstr01_44290 [Pseudomonas straminea]|uniref:DUF4124 domain-containing protein n=1 Tax=Pseudomonas straminea TaxID=47882 RepID=A0A1I1ZAE4_PSEOC|nr:MULTISPECIES: DUF4124 domain-containing protein [Pseudomonas]TWE02054.1 uncharacterized protein DUF4124 [Pseudomonas sp. AG1028]GLX16190.1 hypothetical protein Pstr01_44290 [Pseudomonas straminea]SFE28824.1 protein of unknown function [Pseudomonas straminea]
MTRALVGLLLLPCLAFGQVYRWVDENGQVHFGQQPQAANAQTVEVKPQVIERDAATQEREQRAERYFQARRDEQAQAAQARREQQAQLVKECAQLRAQLASMPEGRRYFHQGASGERHYYSDEQLNAARSQLRDQLSGRCH